MELPKSRVPESLNKFRGVTPSEAMTEFIKNTVDDVSTLYSIINDNNDKLTELQSISNAENRFLFKKNEELNEALKAKERELATALGSSRIAVVNAFNSSEGLSNPAEISQEYRQITLPVQKYMPKLYMHDQLMDINIIPPSLKIAITQTPEQNADMVITENDPIKMADGNADTCWQRKIKVPKASEISDIIVDINITLPYEIISNRFINTISICTHPIQGIDILDIKYKSGDSYKQVPGFTEHSQYQDTVNGKGILQSGPIRLLFGSIESSEIKVTLRQRTKIEEGDFNIFYIGAYSIDVGYSDYAKEQVDFSSIIELDGNRNIINQVSVMMDNKTLAGESFQYKLYTLNEFSTPVFVSDRLPAVIDGKRMMLQGTVIKTQPAAPAINKIELRYETSS